MTLHLLFQNEGIMPYYDFKCANGHTQEMQMSFAEHNKVEHDDQGPYVECNVKYGDLEHPKCLEKAYQVYGNFGFSIHT